MSVELNSQLLAMQRGYTYPAPPWPEPAQSGSVVAWRTVLGNQSYTYVALRVVGYGWFLTGQVAVPLSWAALCFHFPPEDGRFLVLGVVGQIPAPHPPAPEDGVTFPGPTTFTPATH